MSKKKSLGHNPLAYSTRRHASFDFIAPSSPEKEETESDKSTAPDQQKVTQSSSNDTNGSVNKVTASYYLEEPVVLKIRALAEEQDTSYSAIVNEMLKELLNT